MNKVLICGLRDVETLCAVEHFLDEKYKIVGYAEINPIMNFLSWHKGERKPFYTIENLGSVSFEYAVLPFFGDAPLNDVAARLRRAGCHQELVLPNILKPYSVGKASARRS